MDRRKFLKSTAATTAGIGMATMLPEEVWSATPAPSDTVTVALIGCNSMGFGILEHHLSSKGVKCAALCDIDDSVLARRATDVKTKFGQTPELFKDFRKVLERKDIDAVIIGTPDHWHCLIAVYALQAGKHVYVEKPMANTVEECNLMVKASKRYSKQVVQVGQQQRSGFVFNKAMEILNAGKIGKLRKINIWANFNYGIGPAVIPDEQVPPGVDYDMWLGPAPIRPFNKNRFHGWWRMYWDYGGGLVSDWGVHLLDIGLWAAGIKTAPSKVLVYGANTCGSKRSRETFDSMSVVYPGENAVINFDVTAGVQKGPWDMPYGIAFVGDNATMVADRSKLTVYPEWNEEEKKPRTAEYKYTEGKESHREHVANFLDCIRTGAAPSCTPETARAAALHVHFPNIAARTGESILLWDDTKQRFTNSESANNLLKPVYRKPWTLPEV
jgi:predicted dehydrogenase